MMCRVGKWHEAVLANLHSYEADKFLSDNCMVAYVPEHNTAMLVYAALMGGEVRQPFLVFFLSASRI